MKLIVDMTGTRPMLQHNGRMANPIDTYTRRLRELTAKRRKTDDDLVMIMQVEARGACWETPDGYLGVPQAATWRALYDASKAFKRGEDVKRGVLFDDSTAPLLMGGDPVACDDWLTDSDHVDYRPVKIAGRKTMRARPVIPAGWQVRQEFTVLDSVFDLRDLVPIIERAGELVGIGDWRPTYGTFTAQITGES